MNRIRKNILILFISVLAYPLGVSPRVQSDSKMPPRCKNWLEQEVNYIIMPLEKIDSYIGETQVYNTEVWFNQGLAHYGLPSGFNLIFCQKDGGKSGPAQL